MATQEILPGLFQIQIPLPETPLGFLNVYLVKGEERSLIIDTGLNRKECLEAMLSGLQQLNVGLDSVDLFITHHHVDHIGLVSELVGNDTRVFISQAEVEAVKNWNDWSAIAAFTTRHGILVDELKPLFEGDSIYRLRSERLPKLSLLHDKEQFAVGDFRFECLVTPGHSPGHMCLYERSKKILISGDHILEGITPIIACLSDDANPLQDYLNSLDRVKSLDVDLVLPAHRQLIDNPVERIAQIKQSHEERLRETLSLLKTAPMSAYGLASKMSWKTNGVSWDLLPTLQRWFATVEVIAHLRYLEEEGTVVRKIYGGTVFFQ